MNISHDLFYHRGKLLYLLCDMSDTDERAMIRIVESGRIYDIYSCEYPIQDLRFVQGQTTRDIMITWLAWIDPRHKHSRTYLLSFDDTFTVRRVDLLQSTYIGREKNMLPTATQFDDVLLLSQISLVEGWVSLSVYDIDTLKEIVPVNMIKESVSYDFFHAPEECAEKFSVIKISTNEAAIIFYNEFEHRCVYRYPVISLRSVENIAYK
ncbi:hypothetical protein [Pseudescherichia sp.]|uniref:hypothetical protein n=1 Tax=Pseudescherichia sp. TaxID=2055881 RepID=UPI002897F361|nr:hypothetical protein [Pseudescherichia sp.]